MLTIKGPNTKEPLNLIGNKLLILLGATWDDYWSLANEDLKIDYIKDRIYIHSPANIDHEEIFGFLLTEIKTYLKKENLGRILGSRFPIQTIDGKRIEPDLVFLSNTAIENGELTKNVFNGSPTWIIEIISPTYREHDTITKRESYRLLNVLEYWIIDPEYKTVEIIKFKDKKEIYKNIVEIGEIKPQLEGFQDLVFDLETIWKLVM